MQAITILTFLLMLVLAEEIVLTTQGLKEGSNVLSSPTAFTSSSFYTTMITTEPSSTIAIFLLSSLPENCEVSLNDEPFSNLTTIQTPFALSISCNLPLTFITLPSPTSNVYTFDSRAFFYISSILQPLEPLDFHSLTYSAYPNPNPDIVVETESDSHTLTSLYETLTLSSPLASITTNTPMIGSLSLTKCTRGATWQNQCNGNGECITGVCECDSSWSGSDCSVTNQCNKVKNTRDLIGLSDSLTLETNRRCDFDIKIRPEIPKDHNCWVNLTLIDFNGNSLIIKDGLIGDLIDRRSESFSRESISYYSNNSTNPNFEILMSGRELSLSFTTHCRHVAKKSCSKFGILDPQSNECRCFEPYGGPDCKHIVINHFELTNTRDEVHFIDLPKAVFNRVRINPQSYTSSSTCTLFFHFHQFDLQSVEESDTCRADRFRLISNRIVSGHSYVYSETPHMCGNFFIENSKSPSFFIKDSFENLPIELETFTGKSGTSSGFHLTYELRCGQDLSNCGSNCGGFCSSNGKTFENFESTGENFEPLVLQLQNSKKPMSNVTVMSSTSSTDTCQCEPFLPSPLCKRDDDVGLDYDFDGYSVNLFGYFLFVFWVGSIVICSIHSHCKRKTIIEERRLSQMSDVPVQNFQNFDHESPLTSRDQVTCREQSSLHHSSCLQDDDTPVDHVADEEAAKDDVAGDITDDVAETNFSSLNLSIPSVDNVEIFDIPATPKDLNISIPEELLCPISYNLMKDPVLCSDGFTYDRHAIERWLNQHSHSPMTGEPLPHKHISGNSSIRLALQRFKEGKYYGK
ncbi:hypothetical protein P9112_006385 [Eukaryota sp. TZLM1-RC]